MILLSNLQYSLSFGENVRVREIVFVFAKNVSLVQCNEENICFITPKFVCTWKRSSEIDTVNVRNRSIKGMPK